MKSREFVTAIAEKTKKMAGRPGVVEQRELLAKLEAQQWKFQRLLGTAGDAYTPPEKWLHRKGIKKSDHFAKIEHFFMRALEEEGTYLRGGYNEIRIQTFWDQIGKWGHRMSQLHYPGYYAGKRVIAEIESQGFDEHGGWQTGAEFDKKGRGSSINVDLYGIDTENDLYVVQVRQYARTSTRYPGSTRKNYFLIGHNENGNPFAHPVGAHLVRAAIRKDDSAEYVVRRAQAWIWGIDVERLPEVLRNGDVALVPSKRNFVKGVEELPRGMMNVVDSHWIYTRQFLLQGEKLYAFKPTLRHLKGQHPTQKGEKRWYQVVVGNRAEFHGFARPTID